jgi:hypothetical protein
LPAVRYLNGKQAGIRIIMNICFTIFKEPFGRLATVSISSFRRNHVVLHYQILFDALINIAWRAESFIKILCATIRSKLLMLSVSLRTDSSIFFSIVMAKDRVSKTSRIINSFFSHFWSPSFSLNIKPVKVPESWSGKTQPPPLFTTQFRPTMCHVFNQQR